MHELELKGGRRLVLIQYLFVPCHCVSRCGGFRMDASESERYSRLCGNLLRRL